MKTQLSFRIGLIKPVRALIVGRTIKASDRAWREAIFGLGGTKKRLGGLRLGMIDGHPLALIAELQTEIADSGAPWVIQAEDRLYALAGPAAVYNDAGFGPATLGISIDRLKELVTFDPVPPVLELALSHTREVENKDAERRRLV